jgi:hypothetical protein
MFHIIGNLLIPCITLLFTISMLSAQLNPLSVCVLLFGATASGSFSFSRRQRGVVLLGR